MIEPNGVSLDIWEFRHFTINKVYCFAKYDNRIHAFSKAVNFLDRYVSKTGCIPDDDDVDITYKLACALVYADWDKLNGPAYAVMAKIVKALEYELMGDTVESILGKQHGVKDISFDKVRQALIISGGSTMKAVEAYLQS